MYKTLLTVGGSAGLIEGVEQVTQAAQTGPDGELVKLIFQAIIMIAGVVKIWVDKRPNKSSKKKKSKTEDNA